MGKLVCQMALCVLSEHQPILEWWWELGSFALFFSVLSTVSLPNGQTDAHCSEFTRFDKAQYSKVNLEVKNTLFKSVLNWSFNGYGIQAYIADYVQNVSFASQTRRKLHWGKITSQVEAERPLGHDHHQMQKAIPYKKKLRFFTATSRAVT